MVSVSALLAGCATYTPKAIAPAQTAAAFDARSLADPRLHAFLEGQTGSSSVSWDLRHLTLAALYFHPDLEIADARLAVAQAGGVTARERPNPTLGLAAQYNTTQMSPSPIIASVAVNFLVETFGKRPARIAQSQALIDAARDDVAAASWQVRGRVRNAALDLWAARRRQVLIQRRLDLQEALLTAVEHRAAAGDASNLEVARERTIRDQLVASLAENARLMAVAGATLAGAVGVTPAALESIALDLSEFDEMRRVPAIDRRAALLARPDLKALLARYAATEAALRLEVARQYPNLVFGPGYEYDQGGRKIGLPSLSIDLPIFNQNQGAIGEAAARREEAAANFRAAQAVVIGAIDTAAVSREAAERAEQKNVILLQSAERQRDKTATLLRAGQADRSARLSADAELAALALSGFDADVLTRQALGQLEDALQQSLVEPRAVIAPATDFMTTQGPRPR